MLPFRVRATKGERISFRDRPRRGGDAGLRSIRFYPPLSHHIPDRVRLSPTSTLGPRNSRNGRVLEINVHEHGEGGKVIGVLDIGVDDYVCQYPVRIGKPIARVSSLGSRRKYTYSILCVDCMGNRVPGAIGGHVMGHDIVVNHLIIQVNVSVQS